MMYRRNSILLLLGLLVATGSSDSCGDPEFRNTAVCRAKRSGGNSWNCAGPLTSTKCVWSSWHAWKSHKEYFAAECPGELVRWGQDNAVQDCGEPCFGCSFIRACCDDCSTVFKVEGQWQKIRCVDAAVTVKYSWGVQSSRDSAWKRTEKWSAAVSATASAKGVVKGIKGSATLNADASYALEKITSGSWAVTTTQHKEEQFTQDAETCSWHWKTTITDSCGKRSATNHDFILTRGDSRGNSPCCLPGLIPHPTTGECPPDNAGNVIDLCNPTGPTQRTTGLTPLGGTNDGAAINLEACIGECDSDAQCKPGLKCFQRTGRTPVPGCSGLGIADWDYCYDPTGSVELSGGNDNRATGLQACTGECDHDGQCAAGLKCFQREHGETIPGCKGPGAAPTYDYCYDPNWVAGGCPSTHRYITTSNSVEPGKICWKTDEGCDGDCSCNGWCLLPQFAMENPGGHLDNCPGNICAGIYCAVDDNKVQAWTTNLNEARRSIGTSGSRLIVAMVGGVAGDPHKLSKSWGGGSMYWNGWNDINRMRAKCEAYRPVDDVTLTVGGIGGGNGTESTPSPVAIRWDSEESASDSEELTESDSDSEESSDLFKEEEGCCQGAKLGRKVKKCNRECCMMECLINQDCGGFKLVARNARAKNGEGYRNKTSYRCQLYSSVKETNPDCRGNTDTRARKSKAVCNILLQIPDLTIH